MACFLICVDGWLHPKKSTAIWTSQLIPLEVRRENNALFICRIPALWRWGKLKDAEGTEWAAWSTSAPGSAETEPEMKNGGSEKRTDGLRTRASGDNRRERRRRESSGRSLWVKSKNVWWKNAEYAIMFLRIILIFLFHVDREIAASHSVQALHCLKQNIDKVSWCGLRPWLLISHFGK